MLFFLYIENKRDSIKIVNIYSLCKIIRNFRKSAIENAKIFVPSINFFFLSARYNFMYETIDSILVLA